MESNFVYLVICMVLLLISLCTQLAGMASEGWLVIDLETTSETFNFGLYYVDYCSNGSCSFYYITDLPSTVPLGLGNIALVLSPACPISLRGLMIVIATGFIPLSPLIVVSTAVMWESSQWLGKNIVWRTGNRNSRKAWTGALAYNQSISLTDPTTWTCATLKLAIPNKLFSVYRAGTALAAALTFLAVIFLSRYTTQCCASWQTCANHNGHVTCLNCFTLAAGLLATSAAAHYGTEISVRSEELDVFKTPYSIILTGIGGILALVAFFLLAALSCRETDQKADTGHQKFVTPEEYFEKAAPYISDDVPTKVSQPPRSESTLPSSTLTRTYKSSHFVDDVTVRPPKRRVENIELPPISTTKVNPGYLHQSGSKVYYVTLR